MRKSYQYYTILLAAVLCAMQSCKKVDGIDNNSVIETPYTLYFTDSSGSLYNSNNGDTVKTRVFGIDGSPSRAICIAGDNLLWIKSAVQLSRNDGKNFNPTYTQVYPTTYDNSLVLFSKNEKRVYLVSSDPSARLGLVYSTLRNDSITNWVSVPNVEIDTDNIVTATFSSISQTDNGTLLAFDQAHAACYSKKPGDVWRRMANNNLPIVPFYMSHWGEVAIAYDWQQGANGVYFSTDLGNNWNQYTGMSGDRILAACAPFGEVMLLGTNGSGVLKYNTTNRTFEPANNGLGKYAVVTGITYKENIYKNGNKVHYIYISTNYGIYRSVDQGANWSLVVKGKFVSCY